LQETDLVQSGVYQLVRHPLYTSVVFCALAWSLWWNSVPALCCWAVTVVFMDAKARHEEIRLRQRFGHYPEYAARVKRLIPWIY
jgi:protein-S-isoprenylcysteine O-methyltransferase Ste14